MLEWYEFELFSKPLQEQVKNPVGVEKIQFKINASKAYLTERFGPKNERFVWKSYPTVLGVK